MFSRIKRIKNRLHSLYCKTSSEKWINYLREQGVRIGEGTAIFSNPAFVTIDVTRPWMIEIGKNVQIAKNVTILTHDYSYSTGISEYGIVAGSCGKVKIGNNCLIGMGATILMGSEIGDNVIVGANSLVTGGTFPSNCVIAGNPAKVICSLEKYFEKRLAAQINEATELAENYYDVYHSYPSEAVLDEFFWLFAPRTEESVKKYRHRLSLMGCLDKTTYAFLKSEPSFPSYEAFIDFCKKQKEASAKDKE